jgi:hypothetical protein
VFFASSKKPNLLSTKTALRGFFQFSQTFGGGLECFFGFAESEA